MKRDDSGEIEKFIAERGLTRCPTRVANTRPEGNAHWRCRMALRAERRGETDGDRGENGR